MAKKLKPFRPRLVLHFDVNETVLCRDPAGGDSFEDTLNKIIAKNVLITKDSTYETVTWADGSSPADNTPALNSSWTRPPNIVSYYEKFRSAKGTIFTNPGEPGAGYRPLFNQLKERLKWPSDQLEDDNPLCMDGYHFLLPALFRTIHELHKEEREFSLVIRTYGDDIGEVVSALNAYGEGRHLKGYGHVPAFKVHEKDMYKGRYGEQGDFALHRISDGELISDENEVLKILEGDPNKPFSIVTCHDDYHFWKDHEYSPSAGKPLWVDESSGSHHHIFFDDNIKNNPDDSIVSVRSRSMASDAFTPLSGAAICELQGIHLVRVPTYEPILEETWFLKQIAMCEVNFKAVMQSKNQE